MGCIRITLTSPELTEPNLDRGILAGPNLDRLPGHTLGRLPGPNQGRLVGPELGRLPGYNIEKERELTYLVG